MNTEGSFQCDCPLGHELSPSREDCVGELAPLHTVPPSSVGKTGGYMKSHLPNTLETQRMWNGFLGVAHSVDLVSLSCIMPVR